MMRSFRRQKSCPLNTVLLLWFRQSLIIAWSDLELYMENITTNKTRLNQMPVNLSFDDKLTFHLSAIKLYLQHTKPISHIQHSS